MDQKTSFTNNQLISGEGEGNYTWRSQPQFVKCQGCGFEGDTSIIKSIDKKNLIFCVFCSSCYFCYTAYHLRDYTCYTVQHVCPKCQKEMGTFNPCG